MFSKECNAYNALKARLSLKLENQRQKENQTITFRDLVFAPIEKVGGDHTKGEFKFSNSSKPPESHEQLDSSESLKSHKQLDSSEPLESHEQLSTRLTTYISCLAELANAYHQQWYCEKESEESWHVKKANLNTITRLSMYEYSLYTKYPIPFFVFNDILGNLEDIATRMHDNVHLLLSSFAVLNEDNKILNTVVYVQGGKNAELRTFAKANPSLDEPNYLNTQLFSRESEEREETTRPKHYIANEDGLITTISNKGIFRIKTLGGACYTEAIDICLDHYWQHSFQLFNSQLENARIDSDQFITEQVSQTLTSQYIPLFNPIPGKKYTNTLHADPNVTDTWRPGFSFEENARLESVLLQSIATKYKVELTEYPGKLKISKPIFGSDFFLEIFKERKLEGITDEVPAIKKANEAIRENMLTTRLSDLQAFITGKLQNPSISLHEALELISSIEASENRYIELVQWFFTHKGIEGWEAAIEKAEQKGHLSVLTFLIREPRIKEQDQALEKLLFSKVKKAIKTDNLEIVLCLINEDVNLLMDTISYCLKNRYFYIAKNLPWGLLMEQTDPDKKDSCQSFIEELKGQLNYCIGCEKWSPYLEFQKRIEQLTDSAGSESVAIHLPTSNCP